MAPYAGQKALQPYACKGLKVALSPDFPKRFARARRSSKGRISNAPPPIRVHARETFRNLPHGMRPKGLRLIVRLGES